MVELYVVRRLGDVEIADLMGVDVARVTERRRRAFDRLATEAGANSATERAELIDSLREALAKPFEPEAQEAGRPRPAMLVLVAAALAAVVALILAFSGGDDNEGNDGDAFRPAPEGPVSGPRVALRPPGGGPQRGFARIAHEGERARLSVEVSALPDPGADRYALWLYRSVTDARRLASFPGGRFDADLPLPRGYDRYRYLDVSREPDDSIPAHSGESVLRAGLDQLDAPVR